MNIYEKLYLEIVVIITYSVKRTGDSEYRKRRERNVSRVVVPW